MNSFYFFCWIPILTSKIDMKNCYENFKIIDNVKISNISNSSDICINNRSYRLNIYSNYLEYEEIFDDRHLKNQEESVKVKLFFENYKLKTIVRATDSNKKCKEDDFLLAEIIYMDENGFVRFEVKANDVFQAKTVATQVNAILKKIYHTHTHHKEDVDMLLVPVEIKNKDKNDYESIVEQYERKIVDYHSQINNKKNIFLESNRIYRNKELEKIKKAYGEMLYALNLLDILDDRELNKKRDHFLRAKDSFAYKFLIKKNTN